MKLLADASLPGLKEAFPTSFDLSLYHNEKELKQLINKQDILLCRAQLKVDDSLLADSDIAYVATASSGSDNLDKAYLKSRNINFLDAKGCNANAVADYVFCCLGLLNQKELIKGMKVGIVGMGHVGSALVRRLIATGFDLLCYDPLKALNNSEFASCNLEDLYPCDVICVHAELHHTSPFPSLNLIDEAFLRQLNPHAIIINAARGGIVNEEAILKSSTIYCTDVYLNEPAIDIEIIKHAFICTPHIAGHSIEAKIAAISILSKKIHQLLSLPLPEYSSASNKETISLDLPSWQAIVLAFYNPMVETEQLKKCTNLKSTFLKLRKEHTKRHDFYTYFKDEISSSLKDIFQ